MRFYFRARLSPVRLLTTLLTLTFSAFFCSASLIAAEATTDIAPEAASETVVISWLVTIAAAIFALFTAFRFFCWMVNQSEGDPKMKAIAEHVREGARAYLDRQFKVVILFFAVVCALLAFLAFGLKTQSHWVPFAFLTGGFFSGLAGWFGMRTATLASARTAHAAKDSLNSGLQVAFRSGAVMGLVVVGLGLLDISLWFGVLHWVVKMELSEITVTMLCFGMGASSQALFARVGGGIFTKAADVGADLVGKVEAGIPEDDPRNPATIADNVGDNVGDVAGMGADLYESYCGSILASGALGVAAYHGYPKMQMMCLLLPMCLAAVGIFLSVTGIFMVKAEEGASQKNLLKALAKGIDTSAIGVIVASFGLVWIMLVIPSQSAGIPADSPLVVGTPLFGVFGAIVCGLVSGWIIGKWTEYSTSDEFKPTRFIADQSSTGPATVIIAGIAEGFYSVWVPILVIGIAILLAFGFCTGFDFANSQIFAMGLYGVAIAAVGMLSTLGVTLATDAYGPIADNAGGNAEMSGQEPFVRQRTDALDSLGNTTAATGKGFAIGSAALTALALLAAYVEEVRVGFERWVVNSAIVETISDDMSNASALKLSKNCIALRTLNRDGIEPTHNNQGFLLFPALNVSQITPGREKIEKADIGATIRGLNITALLERGECVDVKKATVPDFSRFYNFSLLNPKVLVGVFFGVMVAFVFCAMTMKAVGRAAGAMVDEVRRQFREIKGIMENEAEPDYAACVEISTAAAQREMLLPALLGLLSPVAVGVILGVPGVVGLLVGALTSGFAVAIMMANAGGAWDNAKKYIEAGAHGGKGTDAHKATVVGDTVGDPFKDTSGPSLNILIKLMSMVSVVIAGFIIQYALELF
ncbi:sodium-translocating pyrophosphatase [uncultured Gimesia sp.]|uniref:sodium-translocating pyrophosphatase n=1 Tax=uncultured Gimesia sp. TaxID=1678688 RepID=UPI0030D7E830|tara:strand:+ start:23759 stop:26371 length:2613 start_codon:yes stop_codon:yes gene_type:complete